MMSNTINVNYMSNIFNRYTKAYAPKAAGEGISDTIADMIDRKVSEGNANLSETGEVCANKVETVLSKEDMTLEEYREYISDKIAGFPLHPSQMGNSFAINISDASLQKMKDDPEYEEWLLNDVKGALGRAVPGWYQAIGGPNTYCVLNYENGEKGCWCHMWSKDYKGGKKSASDMFDDESENSVYKRKAEQRKQIEKEVQEKALKKKQMEKELADTAARKKYNDHQQMMEEYYNDWLANNKNYFDGNSRFVAFNSRFTTYELT